MKHDTMEPRPARGRRESGACGGVKSSAGESGGRGVKPSAGESIAGRTGAGVHGVAGMLLLLALSSFAASAQPDADPRIHALLKQGIDDAGEQKYSQARLAFDEVIRRWPDHPAGPLNKAILDEVMSLDFETPVPVPEFTALLDRAIELAERMLGKNPRSWEAQYYLGMAHSYIAYYRFRDGENWVSGLRHGFTASGHLEECLERNPKAYDAMTGLGTFQYWKSRKMSFLTWTPFVEDERYKGIANLRLAEASATYTSAQATNSLIWIYIEEERYGDAIRAAQKMLRRHPANRLFLWGLASAAERRHDWALARDAYQRIVASIDNEVVERRYIEIQARAKIARMAWNLGDRETAQRECGWVLANGRIDTSPFTPDGASRIRHRVQDMEDLRRELSEKQ